MEKNANASLRESHQFKEQREGETASHRLLEVNTKMRKKSTCVSLKEEGGNLVRGGKTDNSKKQDDCSQGEVQTGPRKPSPIGIGKERRKEE